MERLVKGDVVVLPFPYSDLTATKKRPALIIATISKEDVILCQITSQEWEDTTAIQLSNQHFKRGRLSTTSYIKPGKLFIADKNIILYKTGTVTEKKTKEVEEAIIRIIRS